MLKDVKDLDDAQIPDDVRKQIDSFVRRGFKREHLVVSNNEKVFFDKELAETEAFLEILYAKGPPRS